MQQERPWPEHIRLFTWKRRITAKVNPGMIRVSRSTDRHDDHVAALRLVDPHKARSFVVRLIQTGVIRNRLRA